MFYNKYWNYLFTSKCLLVHESWATFVKSKNQTERVSDEIIWGITSQQSQHNSTIVVHQTQRVKKSTTLIKKINK